MNMDEAKLLQDFIKLQKIANKNKEKIFINIEYRVFPEVSTIGLHARDMGGFTFSTLDAARAFLIGRLCSSTDSTNYKEIMESESPDPREGDG